MAMKERNLVTCIILSIVTCGIYTLYWAIMLAKEGVTVKDASDDGVLEIILMLFLPFLGLFLVEKKITEGCQARGIAHSDNSVLYLILGVVGLYLVGFCLMQNDLNKLATA